MTNDLFPNVQDVRTHRSVVAKRAKRDSASGPGRASIHTPNAVCDNLISLARQQYRRGETVLKVEVRVVRSNFTEWAMADQAASRAEEIYWRVAFSRLDRAVEEELKERLSSGSYLVQSSIRFSQPDLLVFVATINVINPKSALQTPK